MAQQVLVYRLTGSAAALGMVNSIAVIPLVPLALWFPKLRKMASVKPFYKLGACERSQIDE